VNKSLRDNFMKTWTHPGGKLRELGAESLKEIKGINCF
jgi:hypothetical protein